MACTTVDNFGLILMTVDVVVVVLLLQAFTSSSPPPAQMPPPLLTFSFKLVFTALRETVFRFNDPLHSGVTCWPDRTPSLKVVLGDPQFLISNLLTG